MYDYGEYDGDKDPAGEVESPTTVDDQVSVGVVAAFGYVVDGVCLGLVMAGSVGPGRVFVSTGVSAK